MPLDLQALMAQRRSNKFELFERYLNGPLVRVLTRRPLTPSDDEVTGNPRARSAKLRAVERI